MRRHHPWTIILLSIVAVVLILLGFFGYGVWVNYRRIKSGGVNLARYTTTKYTAADVNAPSIVSLPRSQVETADDPALGPSDAVVTIVEFGDFECPFSAESFLVIKDLLKKYGDRIRFIYRDFPNPSIHADALPAALSAACADEQDKFFSYHDLLFANQENLASDNLTDYAKQSGLNVVAYEQCVSSQRHLREIVEDYNAGVAAGVRGTPTWFVNGYRIEGAIPYDDFVQIVEAGLAGKL